MNRTKIWVLLVSLCITLPLLAGPKIKIACVGNSITYGAFIPNRELNSYPAQLQAYLGEEYEVKNFGVSATTLLSAGDYPYISTEPYKQSLAYQPDIVFIKLGTNDSKPQNRPHLDQFKGDYLKLINTYRALPSNPRVILLTPVRCFLEGNTSISDSVLRVAVTPAIKEIACEEDLDIINLYNLFGDKWEAHMMPDRLHPSSIGAGNIAAKLYANLSTPATKATDVIAGFSLKPVREFNFHGYKGFVYDNKGVEYFIVKPHRAAKGNPWIWRARFWGHEPQTDIDLLERGFHLTYCDVADLYGSDKALKRWDAFYALAVKAGLNKKVALEGMSRGGLIIYNWAAANPEKVACIYADAPVMDFKSWPMGKGSSAGSESDAKQLLSVYGFSTPEEALNWTKNPIDHAAILAKAGIPMLHVVGDADDVVPVSENTEVFAKRLQEVGYTLRIIHKPGIGHHPHSLNNPEPIVQFILKATGQAENRCIHPVCGNEYRSAAGWTEGSDWHSVAQDIEATLTGKKLKLLMLGNSITQGFGGNRKAVTYKPGKEAMDKAIGKDTWESAGISGDRTQHLLWRLQNGNYNRCQPENAIITIGINNVVPGDDPADIAAGIKACAAEARKQMPNTRIFLFGLLPAGKELDSFNRKACNQIHELLAESPIEGVTYVNPTTWFVNSDGSLKTEFYSGDFLHLSSDGYSAWCTQIARLIN